MEMRLGEVRLRGNGIGQINPFGYSWNASPGVINPYAPAVQASIPNTYGGSPAYVPPPQPAAQDQCFDCTKFGQQAQKGIPSSMAAQLQEQGWQCNSAGCAQRPQATGGYSDFNSLYSGGQGAVATQVSDVGPMSSESFGMLAGRIPLAGGLGRRALG